MQIKRPLSILVIAPTPFFSDRGCHIRINEECQGIIARGHQVKILTYGLGNDVPGLDIERIHHFSRYTKTSAGPSLFKLVLDALLVFKTLRRIRTFRPHVIHAHLHEGVCIAWIARLLAFSRVPILFDAQGSLVMELRNHMRTAPQFFFSAMSIIERWIFRVSQSVVVSSDSLLQLIHSQHLLPAHTPVALAADSANTAPLISTAEISALRMQHGIASNARILLYCGGMTADKGIELFYTAVLPLLNAYPKLHIVWIGGPVELLQKRAEHDGVSSYMSFLGSKPFNITPRLSQMGDIAVDPKPPSSSQASGKMLSYMAIALPIITFDSANREMIDPENFFASPATVEGLRAAILNAVNTPTDTLQKIGKKNYAYLEAHFSWNATAKILEQTYDDLCAMAHKAI